MSETPQEVTRLLARWGQGDPNALEISPATVKRDWVVAKAFLKREMLRR